MSLKQKQKQSKGKQSFKLSPQWAEQILNLETELQYNCTYSVIKELMKLYTNVVEYFEFIEDPKYISYQERMQNMLSNPEVLKVISSHNSQQDIDDYSFVWHTNEVYYTVQKLEPEQRDSQKRSGLEPEIDQRPKTCFHQVMTTCFNRGQKRVKPKQQQSQIQSYKDRNEQNKKKRTAIVKLHLAKQEQELLSSSQSVKDLLKRNASSYKLSYEALENDLKDQERRFKDRLSLKKMEKSASQYAFGKEKQQQKPTSFQPESPASGKQIASKPELSPKTGSLRKISEIIQKDHNPEDSFLSSTQDVKNTIQQIRKNRKHPKFFSIGSEAEMGGGPDLKFNDEKLEQEIQQCLEQMIQKKYEILNKIKFDYEKQILEYEKQKNANNSNYLHAANDLITKLIQHMQKSRENEIQQKSQELDEDRKKAIRQIKINYLKNMR